MLESIQGCALLTLALSKHIQPKNEFNEVHPSIGITCKESNLGEFSLGYFYNSEKRDSFWVAKRKRIENSENFYYELGVSTGYSQYPVVPIVRVGYDIGFAEVFFVPAFEIYENQKSILPVIGIQFKYNF